MKKAMEIFQEAAIKSGFIKAKADARQMIAEFFEGWTGDLIEYGSDSHHIARVMFVSQEDCQNGVHFRLNSDDKVIAGWVESEKDKDPCYHETESDGVKKTTIVTRENIADVFADLIDGMDIRTETPHSAKYNK